MQNLLYEKEFDLHENEPVVEKYFRTKAPSDPEAQGNSEMAYLIVERNSARFLLHSFVRRDFSCCVASA